MSFLLVVGVFMSFSVSVFNLFLREIFSLESFVRRVVNIVWINVMNNMNLS